MTVKAVVMAGGKGTRLRPITYSIPKPIVPIAGKPCISYLLDSFYNAGIKDNIITTGYKFDTLINKIIENKYNDQNVLFSVENEPAGTAGSIKIISGFLDDTFIVGSGDILSDFNIKDILNFHKKNNSKITVVLTEVKDPSQFGIVELKDNKIVRFLEKPSESEKFSNMVNTGIYVIEPEILNYIKNIPYDFGKDLFPRLLRKNVDIYGYLGNGVWLDTGRPNDLIKANQIMIDRYGNNYNDEFIKGKNIIITMSKFDGNLISESYIGNGIRMDKNIKIDNSAIYDNASIEYNVDIENSILMENVTVKKNTKIKNSVIMRNCIIGEDSEIVDSVMSPDLSLQGKSRVYNVSLASKIIGDDI